MKRVLPWLLVSGLLVSCAVSQAGRALKIAVAANLYVPMREIKTEFSSQHPRIRLEVNFGSSGKLTTQILQGADFDVFLSADTGFPALLKQKGYAVTEPAVYTTGRLVLFSVKPRDFSLGINLLTREYIKIISVANPKTAPYGAAGMQALANARILRAVAPKIAYAQTVAQVVQYVSSAADVGLISKSSLFAEDMKAYDKNGVHWIDVDTDLYTPIRQAAVILRSGKDNPDAKLFYEFLFSAKAKAVFTKYGYGD